jgi:hypothetical protein
LNRRGAEDAEGLRGKGTAKGARSTKGEGGKKSGVRSQKEVERRTTESTESTEGEEEAVSLQLWM